MPSWLGNVNALNRKAYIILELNILRDSELSAVQLSLRQSQSLNLSTVTCGSKGAYGRGLMPRIDPERPLKRSWHPLKRHCALQKRRLPHYRHV